VSSFRYCEIYFYDFDRSFETDRPSFRLNKNCRLHRWNILIAEMLTVAAQEKRIYDLKKKNQELEKFKFVLDYKIKELKKQIEPREKDIKQMREQIAEVVSLSRCNINLSILICNH